ncbi:chromate transporter [Sediminibacillus massiliensis]|uniref:chromate transporter n=1 Tax=Sediminibacillus massiliensis TaxID=1926277 RepID=UPI0009886525|nr:chromate transporter [Sediminibacillus massiliensis]
MQMLQLFLAFFKIGLFGFGGGYAMIPLMEQANREHHWIPHHQFTDIIAIAGSSPGPIASNSALFIGYHTAGPLGAIIAVAGNLLPSFLIVLAIIKLVTHQASLNIVRHCLNGIHPVIAALILYAGFLMSRQTDLFSNEIAYAQYLILFLSIILLFKKVSPVWVISCSGLLGILIYSF